MGFAIDELNENELEQLILRDEKTGTYISVLPGHGALLHAFVVPLSNQMVNIIDHYENAGVLQQELNRSFKGAKLSPFGCRIPGGSYYHENVKYQFTEKFSDGSAIHGLLFNKPFRVLEKYSGAELAKVILEYDYKKDDPGYPFMYRCTITYSLAADNLVSIQTKITNLGITNLPVADGWHPYFRLGGNINDWLMHFETIAQVAFDKELIPTGELIPYSEFNEPGRIGHREMDDCFLISVKKDLPSCELFNPENRLKVSFYPSNNYPYLQIYTPPHRQSIAIENLSAAPDCFNNQMGLTLLPAGHSQTFTVHYRASLV